MLPFEEDTANATLNESEIVSTKLLTGMKFN